MQTLNRIVRALHITILIASANCGAALARPNLLPEVLAHYSQTADSLKRAAAAFLVENMEDHSYLTFDLVDTNKQIIPFDVLSFKNYDALVAAFDSLEKTHGVLDFQKREELLDDSLITADFLIRHMDGAFQAWQTRPWASWLSFEQFCEYLLPYRGSNEPLELWQPALCHAYDSAFQNMTQPQDPIAAASIINKELMSWFHFDPRFYYHPTDQSYSEMLQTKLGRCEDMTNLTIFAMRANGLAVTSDFTPYWANCGNNHAWNAILTADGKVVPFMGAEANPGSYSLPNKLAKVYRKTYSLQRNNLAFQVADPNTLPRYLSSKSYVDVTKDYIHVRTITVPVTSPDTIAIAYLCVFNSGEWKPIQWSRISNGAATFTDMGMDVVYLPGLYLNEKVVPASAPFILTAAGDVQKLEADTAHPATLQLLSTTNVKQVQSTDGIGKSSFVPSTKYTLHYWNNGWNQVGIAVAGTEPIQFSGVPGNGLYWLTAENSDREERIFTYEHGSQVWW